MDAVRIFTHSVRQVFGNLGPALRLSVLPLLAFGVMLIVPMYGGALLVLRYASSMPASTLLFLASLLALIVMTLAAAVIGVNWHRYILLNEYPSLIPVLRGREMRRYLLRGFAIMAVYIAFALPLNLLIGTAAVGGGSPLLGVLLMLVLNLALAALVMRLSISLPAVALDQPMSLSEGWRVLRGRHDVVIVLALITALTQVATDTLARALALTHPLLGVGLQLIFYWLVLMVGLSILTTLYGHYVEGRPLR